MKSKPIQLLYLFQGGIAIFILIMAWDGHEKYLTFLALLITLTLSLVVLTEKGTTPKGKLREILEVILYVIALCYLSFAAGKISGDTIKILSSPTPKHLIVIGGLSAVANFAEYVILFVVFLSGVKPKTATSQ